MKRFILLSVLFASTALAQNNRSAVSVSGNDANLCTTTAPCRSFTVALAHTNPGGEVIAFDSGGYGSFTITQAVSVIGAPGVHAAITSAAITAGANDAIDVNADPADAVLIRNLKITVADTGGSVGILGNSYGLLTIENCSVTGAYDGVRLLGDNNSRAMIVDTAVRSAGAEGYRIRARAALVRSRAEACGGIGLLVEDGAGEANVSAVDFAASFNTIGAQVTSGGIARLNLDRALISNNSGAGVYVDANTAAIGHLNITRSTITLSPTALWQHGAGVLGSMGNNLVVGYNANTSGIITLLAAQ